MLIRSLYLIICVAKCPIQLRLLLRDDAASIAGALSELTIKAERSDAASSVVSSPQGTSAIVPKVERMDVDDGTGGGGTAAGVISVVVGLGTAVRFALLVLVVAVSV